ncbi:MAG: hypothetical protein ACRDDH_11865 [Cetobacterium sp.]|uniref:hypothetical protein n=1 Tax=Cetobacterium sp. TaxID=2071632 RepID=UPI003EE7D19D
MRDKLENLVVGYLIILIINAAFALLWMIAPKGLFPVTIFMSAVFFYPAYLIGKNLKKLEKFIKEHRDRW